MKFKDIMLIILIVLVVDMGSFIVYDKLFNNDDDSVIQNNSEGVDTENSNIIFNENKIDNYKNYDGSYGSIETLFYNVLGSSDEYYNISLDLLGNVYYYHKDDTDAKKVLLLENVVDIVSFNDGAGDVEVSYCYMLDNTGNVYKFKVTDSPEKVNKVEISNVSKLLYVSWGAQKDAGGAWALLAVTNDGKYLEMARASV